MEDIWKRARLFAEEAAKRSQSLAIPSAASSSSNRIADLVAETAKKSKELALEASKKADQIKAAAIKQADQIKSFSSDFIPPNLNLPSSISSIVASNVDSSSSSSGLGSGPDQELLQKFGLTDDLSDFVKGLTSSTFQNFPIQEEAEAADDVPTTASNVRKDLTEWQERHATLVLSTVKPISRLRYELCPRVMKERRFWRIYFTLVSTHVAPFEKQYNEELKCKAEEQMKDDQAKQTPTGVESSKLDTARSLQGKKSMAEQDLDTFLLGDLEDSDGGPEEGDGSFGDDFDKIDNSDIEDEKHLKKATASSG